MASKNVQVVNELNFDTLVLDAPGTVLVDFTATWCGPCRLQSAILDQVADEPGAHAGGGDPRAGCHRTPRFGTRRGAAREPSALIAAARRNS